jgi:hypothetical protein
MNLMADRYLLIRHEDGREYAVLPSLYHAQYEPAGFVAVSYEDGALYTTTAAPAPEPTPEPAPAPVDEPLPSTAVAGPNWP